MPISTYSIQQIFGHRDLRNALYVVRDDQKAVVYVGMARVQCVADRMARHIGNVFTKDSPSQFSALLLRNHPQYFSWTVELYTLQEARQSVGAQYDCLPCAERGLFDFFTTLQGQNPSGNKRRPSHGCEHAA